MCLRKTDSRYSSFPHGTGRTPTVMNIIVSFDAPGLPEWHPPDKEELPQLSVIQEEAKLLRRGARHWRIQIGQDVFASSDTRQLPTAARRVISPGRCQSGINHQCRASWPYSARTSFLGSRALRYNGSADTVCAVRQRRIISAYRP